MNITIKPSHLEGEITVPPSKSFSHRAVIAASLANGYSKLENIMFSQDIKATCEAMQDFGVNVNIFKSRVDIIAEGHLRAPLHPIQCNESGSTLRFLVPFGGLVDEPVMFTGKEKLMSRPLGPYFDIFKKKSIRFEYKENMPLLVEGVLKPGKYEVPGDVSSQFITGLLFALSSLKEDSEILVTSPLQSKQYVDITIDVLKSFGIEIVNNNYEIFIIKGGQKYLPNNYRVEGDYSQAAFWIVAGIIGGEITLKDLKLNSVQGDKEILEIALRMGAKISVESEETGENATIKISPTQTKGTIIDGSQCPDIIPILTVLAALSEGKTEIINASRLRIKESDRLSAIASELNKLGANIEQREDGLIIYGKPMLSGGVVDSWNDHRIAMSLAIASIRCENEVTINNSGAVEKSYPHFFKEFSRVGGILEENNA